MAEDSDLVSEKRRLFHPLTRESLSAIESREVKTPAKENDLDKKTNHGEKTENEGSKLNPMFEQGAILPVRLRKEFPRKLASTPLEEVDPFYNDQKVMTFVVIGKSKEIYRFSATNALWILGPFNPIRRLAINIMVHRFFNIFMITTILINCILMTMPVTPTIASTELVFLSIYTIEIAVKVIARGFILQPFTYLRDPWNWLDFVVTAIAWASMGVDLGDIEALRSIRILRAVKTLAIAPGMTSVGSVATESMKNLRAVMMLTGFAIFVFALLGLQIYMGTLTQKCIKHIPEDGSWGRLTDESWERFVSNYTNWYSDDYDVPVCGNWTGAGSCDAGYTCLQGYGENPNYGYTNFDTFGWSLLAAIRLITQDFWENLYRLVIRSSGRWHVIFFVFTIFSGSLYLMNFFLAIIMVSFEKAQKAKETADEQEAVRSANKKDSLNKVKNPDDGIIETPEQQDTSDTTDAVLQDVVVPVSDHPSEALDGVGIDEKKPKVKSEFSSCLERGINFCCVWDCCVPWVKFQELLGIIVFDPFFELLITICIIVNTLFMAVDHHDMDRSMERVLKTGNYVFTATYLIEAILKIIAMSPKYYFKERWNIFDFSIVALSIAELGLEGLQGLSVLRCFRLLRVFRLAKSWSTFHSLLIMMGKLLPDLNNLTFVLVIAVFIFSIIGMQLFGRNYIDNIDRFPDGDLPRWSFTDFLHSFMLVFRVLCGEWIESMWDCMLVADVSCIPFFLMVVVIGNLIVLNIGVAFLFRSFCRLNPLISPEDSDPNKITKAFDRISRMIKWVSRCCFKSDDESEIKKDKKNAKKMNNQLESGEVSTDENTNDHPTECCSNCCYKIFPFMADEKDSSFWTSWANIRQKVFNLVENKYFEGVILIVILASSIALALEDIHLERTPKLMLILFYTEFIFLAIFFVEMLLKWVGLGFKKYFTNGWCWLDFIVVVTSMMDLWMSLFGVAGSLDFHSIRILRALRPLRSASRCERLNVAVNSILQTIRSVFGVVLVSFVFWLIFAIIGVQMFAGKFFKCIDTEGATMSHEIIPDRNVCIIKNYEWVNSQMNFDNVANAYLSLFQVATAKGWIQIMNDAVDSTDVNRQPIREINIYMYLYFIFFFIFGSFYTRYLIMGVAMNNVNERTKKAVGPLEVFMTEDQKKNYTAMRKMGDQEPFKTVPRPSWRPQAFVFDVVTSEKFDLMIMLIIGLNMLVMTMDHYLQSMAFSIILDYINLTFIIIYIIECVMKIFGLRHHYFKEPWNLFDFFVVVLSILGLVLADVVEKYFVSPILLRVARVGKLGHILRRVKSAKGIRTLLFTIKTTLPVIFNMCLLLFLVMFVYAIFGMSFFMHVKDNNGIDDIFNFETFGQSMLLLVQISTSAGWDNVLAGLISEENCQPPENNNPYSKNCASSTVGIAYMLSYLVICFLIFITMYIAVIMETYSQSIKNVQERLTDSDYDSFYKIWQRFDPNATRYVRSDKLSELLDAVKQSFEIHESTETFDISTSEGDQVFCGDVLDALQEKIVRRKDNPIAEATVPVLLSVDV